MPILSITTSQTGTTGVLPSVAYINTNDTVATVTAAGYLSSAIQAELASFSYPCMALVSTVASPGAEPLAEWYSLQSSTASLAPATGGGPTVTLPTIANHLAVFTNTTGNLGEDVTTAINGGNIQAGLSGTGGSFRSYPPTPANGYLQLIGAANSGDFFVNIINASHGQNSIYTIPNSGQANSNFIVSNNAADQHITTGGLSVDHGELSVGLPTGGVAGTINLYPNTSTTGRFQIKSIPNSGNFAIQLANAAVGQNTSIIIPDPAHMTASILLSESSGQQFINSGNLIVVNGTVQSGAAIGGFNGGFQAFPTTPSSGLLALQATSNAAGDFSLSITNSNSFSQNTTLTIPDIAAGTGGIVVSTAEVRLKTNHDVGVAGGSATNTITDAFCTATSVVTGFYVTQTNPAVIQKIVPGAGTFDIVTDIDPGASTFSYVIYK